MKKAATVILIGILGTLLGTVVGEILVHIIRSPTLQSFFGAGLDLGLDPPFTFDVKALALTFGIKLKLNLMGVAGGVSSLILYFKTG